MAKSNVRLDYDELQKLKEQIEKVANPTEMDKFFQDCAKELAARLLRKVIKRTPTGQYDKENGSIGGTLRRGWTTQSTGDSSYDTQAAMYSNMFGGDQKVSKADMTVNKVGNDYVIEVINPVYYASYVEYGHRQTPGRFVPAIGKRLKQGWVEGKFMLTISENEIRQSAPRILEKKLEKYLKECFQ
jgi:hypothetical protein